MQIRGGFIHVIHCIRWEGIPTLKVALDLVSFVSNDTLASIGWAGVVVFRNGYRRPQSFSIDTSGINHNNKHQNVGFALLWEQMTFRGSGLTRARLTKE
jgi:hypothetical protein